MSSNQNSEVRSEEPAYASAFSAANEKQDFIQMGAQFNDPDHTINSSVTKQSGKSSDPGSAQAERSHNKALEAYLQAASRTEMLSLGIQSSKSTRAFRTHLFSTMAHHASAVEPRGSQRPRS